MSYSFTYFQDGVEGEPGEGLTLDEFREKLDLKGRTKDYDDLNPEAQALADAEEAFLAELEEKGEATLTEKTADYLTGFELFLAQAVMGLPDVVVVHAVKHDD